DRFDQVEALPGEAAVIVRLPAEMAVSCGAFIDRAAEIEVLPDATWAQIHDPPQRLFELRLGNVPGAVQVGIERERLGYAYGVRHLQCAAIGKSGRHDILGEIARCISSGAVDLRPGLSRQRPPR